MRGNIVSLFIILLYLTYLDELRSVFTNRLRHVFFQNYEDKVNKFAKSQGLFDQIKNMFSIFSQNQARNSMGYYITEKLSERLT